MTVCNELAHVFVNNSKVCDCHMRIRFQEESNTFMTFQQFDKYQEELLKQVVVMKDTKGKEYANSEDRFANFNRLAPRLGISNLAVCLVYLTKHMDAIESYCKNERTYSTESIQGRIVDAITYLTLLGGMIKQCEAEVLADKDKF
jgi:hypothetical protein